MSTLTMDGFPLIFARDPGMTRRVIQYLEQLRKRDGRTLRSSSLAVILPP